MNDGFSINNQASIEHNENIINIYFYFGMRSSDRCAASLEFRNVTSHINYNYEAT